MKNIFTLSYSILLSFFANAQFNNTYLLNGGMSIQQNGSIIPMSYGSVAFVSTNTNQTQDPPPETLVVTHLGADGTIIYNTELKTPNPLTTFIYGSADLVQTSEGGLLVSCFVSNYDDYVYQPVLFKISAYGNLEWSRTFDMVQAPDNTGPYHVTSLIRVENDTSFENYFLVFASNNILPDQFHTTVLKISAAGNVLWGKEYFDPIAVSEEVSISDIPMDIIYSPSSGNYTICAWRKDDSGIFSANDISVMAIDNNGIITAPFRVIDTPGSVYQSALTYNNLLNQVAITYIQQNISIINNGCAASLIGFMLLDDDLDVVQNRGYYINQTKENYGMSISVDQNNNFILGCFVGPHDCLNIGTPKIPNGALLKLDSSGEPIFFHRYNILDWTNLDHRGSAVVYNPDTEEEQYAVLMRMNSYERVVRTNTSGVACGWTNYDAYYGTSPYEVYEYEYSIENVNAQADVEINYTSLETEMCSCTENTSETYCNDFTEINEEIQSTHFTLYPNPLSSTSTLLSISNLALDYTNLRVYNTVGELVVQRQMNPSGTQIIDLGRTLKPGVYFVELNGPNKGSRLTSKLIVQ